MKDKKIKYETEEQKEVKRFIYVLIGLILAIVAIYFFTRAFITKDLNTSNDGDIEYSAGVINYDVAIVGNMLSRPYDEYYVVAFDSKDNEAIYYGTIISNYKYSEDSIKMYTIDLANELNSKYVATEDDISTKFSSLEELKLGKITLMKIKNKKVTKFITDIDEIEKELKVNI